MSWIVTSFSRKTKKNNERKLSNKLLEIQPNRLTTHITFVLSGST